MPSAFEFRHLLASTVCGVAVALVRVGTAAAEAQAEKGKAPGRIKPKRARDAARGEI
jgi:hypothetical protein